ncbi:uncharacterized protein LOC143282190 [Babylonia areolata]|uniref:uncharacterized protein LOC143282190 n=1 Tax=Babylonia areolata TaxID=304850 RepID=UPI003FD3E25A
MASPPTATGPPPPSSATNIWLPAFMSMFPDVLRRTHCVPPIHFNRVPCRTQTFGGPSVLVQQPPEGLNDVQNSGGGGGGGGGRAGDTVGDCSSPPSSSPHGFLSHVEVNCLPEKNNPAFVPSNNNNNNNSSSNNIKNKKNRNRNKNKNKPDVLLLQQQRKQPARPVWSSDGVTSPVPVCTSDFRDDFAQQHVLTHLQELARHRGEVMFILSQLLFSDYLNQPSYAAAAAQFPRPQDLGKKYRHGEFDILLIHRHYGILIGEVKSVGIAQADFIQTQQAQADANVAKRVRRALEQLERSEKVIQHLVSDILSGLQLSVRKTIFLPYVSYGQLRRILVDDQQLQQNLCQILEAGTSEEAVELCFCSDLVSEPEQYWNVTPAVLERLGDWWQARMSATNTQLNDCLYLELVSRFVGPASSKTVHCVFAPPREVKTDWQAISELGWRLSRLVLTTSQMDLLHRAPPRVCVTGPPGTGKTVVLVLMGLQWLLQGHDVHVISVFYKSLAASQLVKCQLKMTLRAHVQVSSSTCGRIFFHQYNFWDVDEDVTRAIRELTAAAASFRQELFVLMDEAWFGYQGLGPCYDKLFTELSQQVPSFHWWAADVGHINIPSLLVPEPLTVPLRYCSSVLREVEKGIALYNTVHSYTSSGLPTPAEGPGVIHLRHEGQGHEGQWPVLCFRCGQEVAALLRFRLRIGDNKTATNQAPHCPPPLQFRDVFVLTRSSELQDVVTDAQGRVTSKACRFIQGLRDSGVPVCVLNGTFDDVVQWEKDLADVAVGASDWVTAAHLGATNGLERKVVVWLPGRMERGDRGYTDEAIEALDRLASVSRCTTQLIVVQLPNSSASASLADRSALRPAGRSSQCRVS